MHPMSPACTTAPRFERVHSMLRRARSMMLLALLFATSWARESSAQTTDNSAVGITFNPSTGVERRQEAYTQARPWWISRADCIANDVFTFALGIDDPSDPVEIWVGSDNCIERRNDPNNIGQCWMVARDSSGNDRPEIDVPVRNIVARQPGRSEPPGALPASVCDESDDRSGEQLTFYFMVVDGGQVVGSATWNASDTGGTGFDTLGPEPPTSIDVGVGERQLSIGVDNTREDTDLRRFEAFCVPAGTEGPAPVIPSMTVSTGDAGTTSGGPGISGPAPDECFTPILASGARPPDGYSCGVVSKDARNIQTSELTNLQAYAVGVVGQDLLGNGGVVSDIQCGTPIPLDDFFELYSANGGPGGGGFCDLSHAPTGGSRQPLAWLGVFFAGLLWRRERARA